MGNLGHDIMAIWSKSRDGMPLIHAKICLRFLM